MKYLIKIHNRLDSPKKRITVFGITALITFLVPLFYWNEINHRDWAYFNALSLFVRSAVFEFGSFPIFDPWMCGGLNVLANPQNRLFSPTLFFDLLFPPYWANLLPLILYGLLGIWGMFRLLTHLGLASLTAWIGAFLFFNGTWFSLHYADGHIPWGTTQLLPWVAFCFLRIGNARSQILLAALLALFLLDGNIYGFIFSALLGISFLLFQIIPKAELLALIRRPWIFLLAAVASVLTAIPKILPVFLEIADREPVLDHVSIPLKFVAMLLFSPVQTSLWGFDELSFGGTEYRFHEYGCYLGITALIFLYRYLREKKHLVENKKWIFLALFWFWVASGWLEPINPWNAFFQKLPLINNAHLQSRNFILMWFALSILLAKAIHFQFNVKTLSFKTPKLVTFILVEFFIVSSIPYLIHITGEDEPLRYQTIKNQSWNYTQAKGKKPYHYFSGLGSSTCYEPAHFLPAVFHHKEPGYRGEAFFENERGVAKIHSLTPNQLSFSFEEATAGSILKINTNPLRHWRVTEGPARVFQDSQNPRLLEIKVLENKGDVKVQFVPDYFYFLLLSLGLGIFLFTSLFIFIRKTQ